MHALAALPGVGEEVELMTRFAARVGELSTEQLQHIYRGTFDHTPSCSLELSHHLCPSEKNQEKSYPWEPRSPAPPLDNLRFIEN
jgi:nitrate reductase assembly molybdenum cofactor insertion protein NarJ